MDDDVARRRRRRLEPDPDAKLTSPAGAPSASALRIQRAPSSSSADGDRAVDEELRAAQRHAAPSVAARRARTVAREEMRLDARQPAAAYSANLEAREALGLLLGHLDRLDLGAARALVGEADQRLDRLGAAPSKTASTVPSGRLRTQPATPRSEARRRTVSRKKTPWTRPWATTRRRIARSRSVLVSSSSKPATSAAISTSKSSSTETRATATESRRSVPSPSLAIAWSVAGGIRARSPGERLLGVAGRRHRPVALDADVDLLGLLVGAQVLGGAGRHLDPDHRHVARAELTRVHEDVCAEAVPLEHGRLGLAPDEHPRAF